MRKKRLLYNIAQHLRKAALWLSGPAVVFFVLPALMLLLIAGTVAQRYIGLYDAQTQFFSSFIFWLGPLPLPAGYTLIGIIFIGLLCKFLYGSTWQWRKAGINIVHLGVLVLLAGGFLTAFKAEEGYLVIPEGGTARFVSDYYQRQLYIVKDGDLIKTVPYRALRTGKADDLADMPFTLEILDHCRNCGIIERGEAPEGDLQLRGMAEFMALVPQPPEDEDEANLNGLTVALRGAGAEHDGVHILFEAMPAPLSFEIGGVLYELLLGKAQRPLPFAVRLEEFQEVLYPGTDKAQSYHSDVTIIDGALAWPVRIEMNVPLRYRGYTLFQSSFVRDQSGTATVLAVVKNEGWLFPYIGTGIIAAGLLWHALLMAWPGRRRFQSSGGGL